MQHCCRQPDCCCQCWVLGSRTQQQRPLAPSCGTAAPGCQGRLSGIIPTGSHAVEWPALPMCLVLRLLLLLPCPGGTLAACQLLQQGLRDSRQRQQLLVPCRGLGRLAWALCCMCPLQVPAHKSAWAYRPSPHGCSCAAPTPGFETRRRASPGRQQPGRQRHLAAAQQQQGSDRNTLKQL